MKQVEKILHFFLDFLIEWCNKKHTGSVSIVLHFNNGVVSRSNVEQKLSIPSEITKN